MFSQTALALTQVTASVDKNPVVVNESIVLTVIADDSVNNNALDTSALMKDFIVGRTSISTQTSMVNFNTSKTTKWTTVLIPRSAGEFTIPALTVENKKTNPITISVIAANDSQTSKPQDLFITTDISEKNVYVQQQLTLTVKLHFSAELKRGSLTEPTLENANITQIGKDKESETILNGKRYRIIERTYAISPQQSGQFTLKSPLFSGEIMVPSTRRSNFLSFAESKPVSVVGEDIAITVNGIPENYVGAWLPSELLTIHQEWQPKVSTFSVGEPITRTITLTAAGLSEEQLPKIEMPMPKGLKVYPDQAELHTGMNNNHLVSQKVRNFALVASRPGNYELPAMVIPWWNTVTNKLQHATIAAQKITVLPNSDIDAPELASELTPANHNNTSTKTETIIVNQAPWLQWLFLALWLLTSLAWFISTRTKNVKEAVENKSDDRKNIYLTLLKACKNNDGEQALKLILPWINSLNKHYAAVTLDEGLALIAQASFTETINELQQCYFGKNTSVWQGNSLLAVITQINKTPIKQAKSPLVINP